MENYLKETKYIDFNSDSIRKTVFKLITNLETNKQKAIVIHDFVRDEILFGFNKKFYDMKASEVLEAKQGFCNNKSMLFVAMLRCAGIPCRLVYVDIDKKILNGIVDPRTPYVDHSFTEVFLNHKWIKLDSYITDQKMFENAQQKLENANEKLGFGVHANGTCFWDGENDAFSQFLYRDSSNISTREYGVFDDINDFYERVDNPWNKSNFVQNLVFLLFANKMTKEINKIRNNINLKNK